MPCVKCTLQAVANVFRRPFSPEWWLWLALTGFSLGCVSSVKWVGFFVVALVGLYTIEDLWNMLGDLQMPVKTYISHWIARIICLICIPIAVYILTFAIHFAILYRSGPGDAQMSSLFQAGLVGNNFEKNPLGKHDMISVPDATEYLTLVLRKRTCLRIQGDHQELWLRRWIASLAHPTVS